RTGTGNSVKRWPSGSRRSISVARPVCTHRARERNALRRRSDVTREQALSRFIIGAAIGSGTTALAAERGGADLLLAINAGRLRSMGAPSIACMLPILDAGKLTAEFARREVLTQCTAP